MDHDLIEFFLGPGGAAFGAQVVQNQQWHRLHLLEELVVLHRTVGGKGRPKVVQQVGNEGEKDYISLFKPFSSDGHGQMSFTAAMGSS